MSAKRLFLLLPFLFITLLTCISCNKEKQKEEERIATAEALMNEEARLDAFIEVYFSGDDPRFPLIQNSILDGQAYYTIVPAPVTPMLLPEPLKKDDWIRFEYGTYNLDLTLLGTNIQQLARGNGMSTAGIRFVPYLRKLDQDNFGEAIFTALTSGFRPEEELYMAMLSTVAPVKHPLWRQPPFQSTLFFVEVSEVVKDPAQAERDSIDQFLKDNPGFNKKDSVYLKVLTEGDGPVVEKGRRIYVLYSIYTLDKSYLFATNDESEAIKNEIYSPSRNYLMANYVAGGNAPFYKGLAGTSVGLKVGSTYSVIVPSALAQKDQSLGNIQPYEPVLVEITIVKQY